MIRISTDALAKRYQRQWLFQNLNLSINSGDRLAILGPNGSGKSTLLKVICGYVAQTKGNVTWEDEKKLELEHWHSKFSFSAPYIELIEEYTLREQLNFHFSLKSWKNGMDRDELIDLAGLSEHQHKELKYFSSGMKQRVKLLQTLCSSVDVYILDEPTVNLDENGILFYNSLIKSIDSNAIVIVGSNDPREFEFCTNQVRLEDHKPKN